MSNDTKTGTGRSCARARASLEISALGLAWALGAAACGGAVTSPGGDTGVNSGATGSTSGSLSGTGTIISVTGSGAGSTGASGTGSGGSANGGASSGGGSGGSGSTGIGVSGTYSGASGTDGPQTGCEEGAACNGQSSCGVTNAQSSDCYLVCECDQKGVLECVTECIDASAPPSPPINPPPPPPRGFFDAGAFDASFSCAGLPVPQLCQVCDDGSTVCAHYVEVDGGCELALCPEDFTPGGAEDAGVPDADFIDAPFSD